MRVFNYSVIDFPTLPAGKRISARYVKNKE